MNVERDNIHTMTGNFDLVSIGDSTTDLYAEIEEATVLCNLNREECKLQLEYADKIPVKKLTRISATGNAANNAIAATRLGLKTTILTIVGNDPDGLAITETLQREGVDTSLVQIDKAHNSNAAIVINFQKERTILSYHEPRKYELPNLPPTKNVFLTSLGPDHETLYDLLQKYIEESNSILSYSPGTIDLKQGGEKLQNILHCTTHVFLNKEEAQELLQRETEIKELALNISNLGPKTVIITDAEKGAYAFENGQFWHQEIIDKPVVERTGAGDAFAAGFLVARINEESIENAMLWGALNSSTVLQFIGPHEGLLRKDEMNGLLTKYSALKATRVE